MNSTLPKLKNAPVVLIIGQVRFSPILAIESSVPKIQAELRKKGFPKYDKVAQQSFGVRADGGAISPSTEYSWRFTDRDDRQSVVMATNAVTLQSALNQTAEEFDQCLFDVVSILYKVVEPDLIQRIGLRYINVIQPNGKALSDYVHEGLLGVPLEQVGATSSVWHLYSVNQTAAGVLIFQARYPISDVYLPPDVLMGPILKLRPLQKCPSFVLDLDHFAEINAPFAMEPIEIAVQKFHSVLDRAFTLAVKESALAEWR
ncbi:MAG: TIGR04255 family protein [Chthoniobacterales bacterium]